MNFRYDVAFPVSSAEYEEAKKKVEGMMTEVSWPYRIAACPGGVCVIMIQGKKTPGYLLNDGALALANKIQKAWSLPTVVIHKSYVALRDATFDEDVAAAMQHVPQSLITEAEADRLFEVKNSAKQDIEDVEDVFDLDSKEAELAAEKAARMASRNVSVKRGVKA